MKTLRWTDASPQALKGLPNPSTRPICTTIEAPEVTFLGAARQPDFATLRITYTAGQSIIELKSLKEYLYQYREILISYERLVDLVYTHLSTTYQPERLAIRLTTTPRGGMSSSLTLDSAEFKEPA